MDIRYINILKILSSLYIISFIFHNIKTWEYIRISEYIFLIILLYFVYLQIYKKVSLKFSKIEYYFLIMPILSIILFFFSNLDFNFFLGIILISYLYLIFFIFKNIIKIVGLRYILKTIILLSLISALLGIIGWSLSQFGIDNILSINSKYPLFIGKVSRASALFTTPSLLAITIIIGIYILIVFFKENKNKIFYSILIILLIGLFLTFSKSIVLFLSFLLLLFYNKKNYFLLNFLIYFFVIFLLIFHSLFTSFLFINKNSNNEWLTTNFTPLDSKPIFQNEKIIIIPTNYTYSKIKSIKIIKDHPFIGIGYNKFKNSLISEYKFLSNKYPHSSYLGLSSEFGLLMAILYLFLLIFILFISLNIYNKSNVQIFIIICYFIFEGIHTDIHTIKLIWIVFAITTYLYKNRLNKFC